MINRVIEKIKCFGIIFTIKYYYFQKTHNDSKYIKLLYDYLSSFYHEDIIQFNSKIRDKERKQINDKTGFNVFVCWWQGEDKMPALCKKCYERLKCVLSEKFKLILITQDNFTQYAKIPDYILNLFSQGRISITQFSDILREALIAQNGGIWIDSTVWTNEGINKYIEEIDDFWSIKLKEIYNRNMIGQVISQCQWSGFILGGEKQSPVFDLVYKLMCKYFQYHSVVIDYFIQNLILRIVFDQTEYCRRVLDNLAESNPNLYYIEYNFNSPFDNKKFMEINNDTSFFKLTYKGEYKEYIDGTETYYKYIMNYEDQKLENI